MNEEICCITSKRKTAKNEWENGDCDFLQALYSVYKTTTIFHTYLLTCLRSQETLKSSHLKNVFFSAVYHWDHFW